MKIGVVAVVASLIAWFYASGIYKDVDPEQMRTWVRNAGAWGGVLFIVSYSFLQPLGVNGLVFLISAPLIWTPAQAFALNWAGTVGCGFTSFVFARFVARDWVQKRLPKSLHRFDSRLETHGLRTVLLLRFVFYTSPAMQYALGVSRVATWPFVTGTVLGVGPFTLLVTLLGVSINAWLVEHPIATWPWDQLAPVIVAIAVVLAAALVWIIRKWRARAVE